MKKKILTLLPLLLLASCNYDNTLYNKTYNYHDGEIYYNFKSIESDIKTQINEQNIDWAQSGVYTSDDESGTLVTAFDNTQGTFDGMVTSMKKIANDDFKNAYKNLKIIVKSQKDAEATVHFQEKDYTCQITTNDGSYELGLRDKTSKSEDDDFKLSTIGDISGSGVHNGKWTCLCFKYVRTGIGVSYIPSKICFAVRYKKSVGEYNGASWMVYALINN